MSLSARVRFEVLKRDRFTCAYCGKHPPDVLLEVDHVLPRAAGGTDAMENLVTSCHDCNAGKSDRLLEEGAAPNVRAGAVEELRERLAQAEEYAKLVGQEAGLLGKQQALVLDYWARAFGAKTYEQDGATYWALRHDWEEWPNENSIRLFLRRLPIDEILSAIDIAASRANGRSGDHACRLFYKMCWRRIKGETGPIGGPRGEVEHGEGRCVPADEYEAVITDAKRDRDHLSRVAEVLAFWLSELSGESDVDILARAEEEAHS